MSSASELREAQAPARPEPEDARDPLRAIVEAVLYEGYLLWPYRRSALKNRTRWTLGGIHPHAYCAATDRSELWWRQTECLLQARPDAQVDVEICFLQVVERRLARAGPAGPEPADALEFGAASVLAWDEATERQVLAAGLRVGDLARAAPVPIAIAAGAAAERVGSAADPVGVIERSWEALRGAVAIRARELEPGLFRLRVRVANTTPWHGGTREHALRRSFVSVHAILHARGGEFVSQTDPPDALLGHAARCHNSGTWPVLLGAEGERSHVLSSPVILPDYPRVAPESPGDLFDAAEIDQLLVLSVLALGAQERREMAASDPRARAILERIDALPPEAHRRLHGAIRRSGPGLRS